MHSHNRHSRAVYCILSLLLCGAIASILWQAISIDRGIDIAIAKIVNHNYHDASDANMTLLCQYQQELKSYGPRAISAIADNINAIGVHREAQGRLVSVMLMLDANRAVDSAFIYIDKYPHLENWINTVLANNVQSSHESALIDKVLHGSLPQRSLALQMLQIVGQDVTLSELVETIEMNVNIHKDALLYCTVYEVCRKCNRECANILLYIYNHLDDNNRRFVDKQCSDIGQ